MKKSIWDAKLAKKQAADDDSMRKVAAIVSEQLKQAQPASNASEAASKTDKGAKHGNAFGNGAYWEE